ncbi:hypothetical protein [Streptomyces paromomycinus]|uniref:Uncharacterized protein n=1 Tax=Streptomyces paromomycinus TaxID=92743 RepID=A0A401WA85_STREY|nr:hypothetical protein GKJPGBOP_05947 [Streptomyces paromomycinus]
MTKGNPLYSLRKFTRAAVVSVSAAGAVLAAVPVASACPAHDRSAGGDSCRFAYTSFFPSPSGATTGDGLYAHGRKDPTGRTCDNGGWVGPNRPSDT